MNLDRFRPPREGGGGGGGGDDCNNDQRKYAILLFRCAVDPQIAGFWSCQSFANLLPYAIYIAILREQLTNLTILKEVQNPCYSLILRSPLFSQSRSHRHQPSPAARGASGVVRGHPLVGSPRDRAHRLRHDMLHLRSRVCVTLTCPGRPGIHSDQLRSSVLTLSVLHFH